MDVLETDELSPAMDLSETAIETALETLGAYPSHAPLQLIVPEGLGILAGRLAERKGITDIIVLPLLAPDDWAIRRGWHLIWSKGA